MGNCLESSSPAILVGTILVGRLGVQLRRPERFSVSGAIWGGFSPKGKELPRNVDSGLLALWMLGMWIRYATVDCRESKSAKMPGIIYYYYYYYYYYNYYYYYYYYYY